MVTKFEFQLHPVGPLAQLGLFFSELNMRAKAATAGHSPRLQAGPARVPNTEGAR